MAETEKELLLRVADCVDRNIENEDCHDGRNFVDICDITLSISESHTISRVLREAAEGCAPKEDPKSYWGWYAGANEEWCTIGPCSSRDEVIAEATDEVLGEFQDGDTWKLGFHICEANKPPLRLADWIGADDLLGQAEVAICDSDRVSCEYDEGPWFHASAEQEADLERRVKAACDAWQAAHGLVFTCTSFSSSRNHEHVVVPHPLPEPPPPARIEDAEEPSHG